MTDEQAYEKMCNGYDKPAHSSKTLPKVRVELGRQTAMGADNSRTV